MATTLNTVCDSLSVPDTVNTSAAKVVKKARSIRDSDALPDFTHCEFSPRFMVAR